MLSCHLENPSASGEPARLRLEGPVTVETAVDLKGALLETLEGHDRVVVDCAGATGFDVTALQIFCAAHRTAVTLAKVLTLTGCREELFEQAVREAGFGRMRACLHSPDPQACLWVAPRVA